jgi:hypothetical protein
MKKHTLSILLFSIFVISFSKDIRAQADEELGVFAVEALNNLKNSYDFMDNFINEDLINTLYDHNKNNTFLKKLYNTDNIHSKSWKMYDRIRESGAKKGIIWEDIEYVDFFAKDRYLLGRIDRALIFKGWLPKNHYLVEIYGTTGWLFWKYNNQVYKIGVWAIFVDDEYRFVELVDLIKVE